MFVYPAETGGTDVFEQDFSGPVAIVLGSEGEGISRLVRERSDFVVSIPMHGKVNSLNVSAAAAIVISLARRARAADGTR